MIVESMGDFLEPIDVKKQGLQLKDVIPYHWKCLARRRS